MSESLCQLLKGATGVEVRVCLNVSVSDRQIKTCAVLKKHGEMIEKDNNDTVKQSRGNSVKGVNACDRFS